MQCANCGVDSYPGSTLCKDCIIACGGTNFLISTEQDVINMGIKHGDEFECPTCGAPGRIDSDTKAGDRPEFKHSVWWNSHTNGWECYDCWLK